MCKKVRRQFFIRQHAAAKPNTTSATCLSPDFGLPKPLFKNQSALNSQEYPTATRPHHRTPTLPRLGLPFALLLAATIFTIATLLLVYDACYHDCTDCADSSYAADACDLSVGHGVPAGCAAEEMWNWREEARYPEGCLVAVGEVLRGGRSGEGRRYKRLYWIVLGIAVGAAGVGSGGFVVWRRLTMGGGEKEKQPLEMEMGSVGGGMKRSGGGGTKKKAGVIVLGLFGSRASPYA